VVTLNAPSNSYANTSNSVVFNCSATDDTGLTNITLYGNWTGSFAANVIVSVTGLSNSTTFTKTLVNNNIYLWNCLVGDDSGNSVFAPNNFTFILDNTAPSAVTNLLETSTGVSSITWNWTNPSQTDFNYAEIYKDGTFIANVSSPTHEYKMLGLSASTTYTISLRTVDNIGNINTIFVNDSALTKASSGVGNASTGTTTTETAQTSESAVVKKETKEIIETIEPGENKIISIETVSVKEISITAKNKISNLEIEVKQVETLPENITKPVNHVFSYFEINTLNVSEEDIENVSITFRVDVSLANENNIDKDSIILNRFKGGNWAPLETSFISEENGEYIYKALSNGFSLFAISGEEKLGSSSILGKIKEITEVISLRILIIIIVVIIILILLFTFREKILSMIKGKEGIESKAERLRKELNLSASKRLR